MGMLCPASRFLTGLFLLQSLITRGAVYMSNWRSVTLSASSSLGQSPELPWLILEFWFLCGCNCKELHNFLWTEEHTLSINSTITCPSFGRISATSTIKLYNMIIFTTIPCWKKSPYSWLYQENNYIPENIFRQRLKIAIRVGLGFEAWFWMERPMFSYGRGRQAWKAFSAW